MCILSCCVEQFVVVESGLVIWSEERKLEDDQHWEFIEEQLARRQPEIVCNLLHTESKGESER
jgi:hypothetical protein